LQLRIAQRAVDRIALDECITLVPTHGTREKGDAFVAVGAERLG
jgi:hypothetical protein